MIGYGMAERVLLCNAGSSSLKLLGTDLAREKSEEILFSGSQDEIFAAFESFLTSHQRPDIVLHRIVHAGSVSEAPEKIDSELRARIKHWQPLAPLHNTLALALIDAIDKQWPDSQQLAIFDSGLFSQLPPHSRRYALADNVSPQWPVQRYGFHGLAHRSQMRALQSQGSFQRVITLQLGGGSSAAAWLGGVVLDTSMGFTPMEGLPMGSRSGSIDPGIVLHLISNENMSLESVQELLNDKSGLKALSGGVADMRELLASEAKSARFAVEYYCYHLRKLIGSYIAILGGIDAVTIGGGIGENQAEIRNLLLQNLEHLCIEFDESANVAANGLSALQKPGSTTQVWLTPVDEADEMLRQYKHYMHLHRL